MKTCPYCFEQVKESALRCPHCSSWFDQDTDASRTESGKHDVYLIEKDNFVYVADRGLVRFGKFVISVLAVFLVIGAFFYGFDLEKASEEVNQIHEETQDFKDELVKDRDAINRIRTEIGELHAETAAIKAESDNAAEAVRTAVISATVALSTTKLYRDRALVASQEAELRTAEIAQLTEQDVRALVESTIATALSGLLDEDEIQVVVDNITSPTNPLDTILEQPALRLVQAREAIAEVGDGLPVRVAILSEGAGSEAPQLEGRLAEGEIFGDPPTGTPDHFSAVASLAAAIAPQAEIVPIKVLGPSSSTKNHALSGLEFAIEEKIPVVIMPFGSRDTPEDDPYAALAEKAAENGVLLLASAGNLSNGQLLVKYPGATPGVIAVASTNNDDQRAGFTVYGDWISLAAPGEGISALRNDGSIGVGSGTSYSVAIAGGIAALMLSANPGLTYTDLVSILRLSAVDIDDPDLGVGRVDALEAIRLAKQRER